VHAWALTYKQRVGEPLTETSQIAKDYQLYNFKRIFDKYFTYLGQFAIRQGLIEIESMDPSIKKPT